jgi:CO dehydrogenase/acetyl-CoA synthase beta subunit
MHIPLTTEERAKLKAGIYLKWDGTTSLRSYIYDIKTGMKDASFWKVSILPQDIVDHLVQQIYEIDPFKEKVMTEWGTRPTANKIWERCVQYFLKAADKLKIHQKATAKQPGYHSAANVQEEEEKAAEEEAQKAAEQEEHLNMVLEAMENSGEQMNAVVATATNAKMEATIAELTKQVAKLTDVNNCLVKALLAWRKSSRQKQC